jgi:hypothetical protein
MTKRDGCRRMCRRRRGRAWRWLAAGGLGGVVGDWQRWLCGLHEQVDEGVNQITRTSVSVWSEGSEE